MYYNVPQLWDTTWDVDDGDAGGGEGTMTMTIVSEVTVRLQ
jgi:hypothetical protein